MFICILSSISTAAPVVYKLDDNYIAVRNDVFNKLTESDKLTDSYKKDIEYYKSSINQLKEMQKEKDELQDKRIGILKDTIIVKNEIITLKDENINNYKSLYTIKSNEVRKIKTKSIWQKVLTVGLGAWAISEMDDDNAKYGVGVLTLYLATN
jgi:hypothetical protein